MKLINYGQVRDLDGRDDLIMLLDEHEISHVCENIGWDTMDEDEPTGLWINLEEGDYGDIFCTFSSRPYDLSATLYELVD